MSLQALQNCVIMERDVEKHPLFVLPPGDAMETGKVISVGPLTKTIKVGDHVYFGVGQNFKNAGKDYVVMREDHVLGVLEDE